jgi:hypothetical protein
MATTTNYGWTTPDDTDLVKDGAAAIRTLGSSVDTTTKALNPSTTEGDIEYRSATANTNTRLPIGTAGQVLAVNSGADAPEWVTPAVSASGLTLISTTSFSNVASQAFDNVFTTTYFTYLVVINNLAAVTPADDLHLQFRYGSTTQASDYYGSLIAVDTNAASVGVASSATAQMTISRNAGSTARPLTANIYFNQFAVSGDPTINGRYIDNGGEQGFFGCLQPTTRTYNGFLLKAQTSNITGSVSIYGLAK